MSQYLRLDRFIVEVLGDAKPDDIDQIKKSKRKIHNRLACGTVPRKLFRRFGRDLYVDISAFHQYMKEQS